MCGKDGWRLKFVGIPNQIRIIIQFQKMSDMTFAMGLGAREGFRWLQKTILQCYIKTPIQSLEKMAEYTQFSCVIPINSHLNTIIGIKIIQGPFLTVIYTSRAENRQIVNIENRIIEKIAKYNRIQQQLNTKFCYDQQSRTIQAKVCFSHDMITSSLGTMQESVISLYVQKTGNLFQDCLKEIFDCVNYETEPLNEKHQKCWNTLKHTVREIQKRTPTTKVTPFFSHCHDPINTCNNDDLKNQLIKRDIENKIKESYKGGNSNEKIPEIMRVLKFFNTGDKIISKESNYSEVKIYKAKFQIIKVSIHQDTIAFINQKAETEEKVEKQIVEKIPKKGNYNAEETFKIEFAFVKYLRAKKCKIIASFFVKQIIGKQSPTSLFSEFYPYSIEQKNLKARHIVKIIADIAFGIGFLYFYKLTHRDLKPNNIVLNERTCPKIIDFGSAHAFDREIQNQLKVINPLTTTREYNLIHSDLEVALQRQISKKIFEEHANFDVYAFGKIVLKMITPKIREDIGNQLFEYIQWVVDRCLLQNPNERLNPLELTAIFKQIRTIYEMNKRI